MNLDAAEALVRQHWCYLENLWCQYADVETVALRAAAAQGRLHERLRSELAWDNWRPLYARLCHEPHARAVATRPGSQPLLTRLWEVLDRRKEFGIPEPRAGVCWRGGKGSPRRRSA